MRRDVIAALVVVMVLGSAVWVEGEGPATRPAGEVERIIGMLWADDWKVRQEAQERLVEMGPGVVEQLKQVVREAEDEEVRTRVEAALRQIEANDRSGPTLVTLHLNNTPLPTVIRELAKQANTEIAIWPPGNPQQNAVKISIDVDRKPFWVVVREICEKGDLAPERTGPQRGITLMPRNRGDWAKKPMVVRDGFLITAERANRSHSLEYASGDISNTFTIQFRILIDPKQQALQRPQQIQLEEAVDEKGNSLAPSRGNNRGIMRADPWGTGWMCDIATNLTYQPDMGKRLAVFKGDARFVMVTRSDTWQIADVLNARDVEHAIPIGKYTVRRVSRRQQQDQYQADILVEHMGGQGPQQHPLMDYTTIQQCVRLVDAKGMAYMPGGGSASGIGGNRMQYQMYFMAHDAMGRKLDPPDKLIWEVPMELKEVVVPIEFKDLAIP